MTDPAVSVDAAFEAMRDMVGDLYVASANRSLNNRSGHAR